MTEDLVGPVGAGVIDEVTGGGRWTSEAGGKGWVAENWHG
jgi:hypothetical protein